MSSKPQFRRSAVPGSAKQLHNKRKPAANNSAEPTAAPTDPLEGQWRKLNLPFQQTAGIDPSIGDAGGVVEFEVLDRPTKSKLKRAKQVKQSTSQLEDSAVDTNDAAGIDMTSEAQRILAQFQQMADDGEEDDSVDKVELLDVAKLKPVARGSTPAKKQARADKPTAAAADPAADATPTAAATPTWERPTKRQKVGREPITKQAVVKPKKQATPSKQAEVHQVAADPDVVERWKLLHLHPALATAVARMNFTHPTPIQRSALPAAIRDYKSCIGAAATGSGKTLSFVLPILHRYIEENERQQTDEIVTVKSHHKHLFALILSPTRELALQIQQHTDAVTKKHLSYIHTTSIVGGISVPKQIKRLSHHPAIVVATPGRLWELINTASTTAMDDSTEHSLTGKAHKYIRNLRYLRFLVLDEADRMLARGHFPELQSILELIEKQRKGDYKVDDAQTSAVDDIDNEAFYVGRDEIAADKLETVADDEEADAEDAEVANTEVQIDDEAISEVDHDNAEQSQPRQPRHLRGMQLDKAAPDTADQEKLSKIQIFLFSATFTLPTEGRVLAGKQYQSNKKKEYTVFDELQKRIKFFDTEPHLIDLSADKQDASDGNVTTAATGGQSVESESTAVSTPAGLTEYSLQSTTDSKDNYLYYILTQLLEANPNGTKVIVFVNAISSIKRLVNILTILTLPYDTYLTSLHAQQQQRQRLNHLEGFTSAKNAVVIATDVAARGLDIPTVTAVVHYQLTRNAELYVHRVGRTARAGRSGTSIALVSQAETKQWKTICSVLDKSRSNGAANVQPYPVNQRLYDICVQRIGLARKIESLQHQMSRSKSDVEWMTKQAEEMDIIVDDETLDGLADRKKQQGSFNRDLGYDSDDVSNNSKRRRQDQQKAGQRAVEAVKQQLKQLMHDKPLQAAVKQKFLTANDPAVVQQLVKKYSNKQVV